MREIRLNNVVIAACIIRRLIHISTYCGLVHIVAGVLYIVKRSLKIILTALQQNLLFRDEPECPSWTMLYPICDILYGVKWYGAKLYS